MSGIQVVRVTGSWCLFRPNTCRRTEPFSLSLTWKKKVGTKDAGSSLDLPLPSYQIQSEVSFSIHLFNKSSTLVTLVPFQLNNHKKLTRYVLREITTVLDVLGLLPITQRFLQCLDDEASGIGFNIHLNAKGKQRWQTPSTKEKGSFGSWCLNQLIWKICSSKLVHLPQGSG